MFHLGEKGLSKAGNGCPSLTLEVGSMTHDGDTNTQPKVQTASCVIVPTKSYFLCYSPLFPTLIHTPIIDLQQYHIILIIKNENEISKLSFRYETKLFGSLFLDPWYFFVPEKDRPSLRPARSMDSLSTPSFSNEKGALTCFLMDFGYNTTVSSCVCVGSLRVLQLPPTLQRRAC